MISEFSQKQPLEVFYEKRLQVLGLQLYSKRDCGTGGFTVNFAKFLKTSFLQNTSGRPLLLEDTL